MIRWPSDLVLDLARRRCIPILGSGVSRQCANALGKSPKTWKEFLDDGSKLVNPNRHIKALIKKNDYLTACEIIKEKLGDQGYYDLVTAEYLTPAYQSAPIHKHIFTLDSKIVITPNFDKIYDTYAVQASSGTIKVKKYYDGDLADSIRRSERIILKIHGTIDSPSEMIFTRTEYGSARTKHSNFYRILDALALTHTLLFIGCGTSDPDLRLILEDFNFKYSTSKTHYMVLPSKLLHKDEVKLLKSSLNIEILTYDPKGGHKLLVDSLENLAKDVEASMASLKITGDW